MKGYRLTEKADAHLQEIWRHSRERWGKKQADAYLADIDAALTMAIATPSLLRPRPELGDGVVARRARSHVVYGFVADDTLVVIAVLHGRMDPKRHLGGDEP
ncbi:MAG: type II toxin-antitoxin system RelE/ParE family toxin [Vitreimonas sp.]